MTPVCQIHSAPSRFATFALLVLRERLTTADILFYYLTSFPHPGFSQAEASS
jgi:hypothetical protein